jgi:glycosyltransferase involved in cell wall biosynthesis
MASEMDHETQLSVVMCVHNGGPGLQTTLESTLSQQGVDLEFIVVDDGSTDETSAILRDHAVRDDRLRILERKHVGLTRSLIYGCAEANGQFIARKDAGDVSLPGRLSKELAMFRADPNLALISCGTRFLGPNDEFLYVVQKESGEADEALRSPNLLTLRGPSHHGCTMFRREDYLRAGGYRPQFEVAQDLDLWTRLVELGRHEVVQEVLYEAKLASGAISSEMRNQQEATTKIIAECMRSRMITGDDSEQLKQVACICEEKRRTSRRRSDANFYYFLAACLRRQNPSRSRHYLMAALKRNPLHFRALARAIQAQIGVY